MNTLFLPELLEMLEEADASGLHEFCHTLHPARTADFMEGLSTDDKWRVMQHADWPTRGELFGYFSPSLQVELVETQDRHEVATLIAELPPDDRVDLLAEVDGDIVDELLKLMPVDERRDILRLSSYPDGVAGAVMTTEVALLKEGMTVREALEELSREAAEVETIYYFYIVDDENHLRGIVSARQLVAAFRKPDTTLGELMETDMIVAHVGEDQEDVANKVARLDLLAIPVVDDERRMLGIITHDDVIDVVREEATEDAHRIAAVDPLDTSYLQTHLLTLSWKRGIWLTILFFAAMLTAFALRHYEAGLDRWTWLVMFIPLVISSGGNSGSQSATLIITAISTGDIRPRDWWRVVWRELQMGIVLGGFLAAIGYACAAFLAPSPTDALVVPLTLLFVVICGTLSGSILPMLFHRLGWDPALMSSPFVAGIIDIAGIVIYMNVAMLLLSQ